jgi:hypothetical protein
MAVGRTRSDPTSGILDQVACADQGIACESTGCSSASLDEACDAIGDDVGDEVHDIEMKNETRY